MPSRTKQPLLPSTSMATKLLDLVDKIDRNQCDCTHSTLRVGSPQVLVCKKTTAIYERACKTYEQDLKHLAAIRKIASKWDKQPQP